MLDSNRLVRERTPAKIGMVHIGPGAFFRAFNAIYTQDAASTLGGDWGIAAVSLKSATARDQLEAQECLYTAIELAENGKKARQIDIISDVFVAPENPAKIVDLLAHNDTKIVSLTITEKGYCRHPSSGELDLGNPDIAHDLKELVKPHSAIGFIVAAMRDRMQAGLPALTVVSCDNLPQNGKTTKQLVLTFARLVDTSLAAWIEQNAKFPCTMVDRITPATTPIDVAQLQETEGYFDPACVVHEPFRQWVIEDSFVDGRPDWEAAGAQMVASVQAHEHMKLRCLNGVHSALAYLGYLAGYETIAETTRDDQFAAFCVMLWRNEIVPNVPTPEGENLEHYCLSLLKRFQNPAIHYRNWQIAMDGSQKLPQRILSTIQENLDRDFVPNGLCLAVAAWIKYVGGTDLDGQPIDVRDPLAPLLQNASTGDKTVAQRVASILDIEEVFSPALRANDRFVDAVVSALATIEKNGTKAAVKAYLS